ncbi:hypothetical protein SO694_00121056 [Aureococcus anophagefferens]|uniref:CR-type domain-containing protein n=1 Tax=Aureococcus anophagefferens TaxID=44056 RepID=A0ABR1G460_AURAN
MGVQLFKLSLATLAVVSSFTAPGAPAPAPRSLVRRHMDLDTVRLVGDGAAAFVGGSMGVAGTLAVYENNRFHAKQRVVCAYCASAPRNPFRAARPPPPPVIRVGEGTGYLKCATCMGTGLLADGSKCHTCEGADAARADGKHVCVNCEGTGLTIPAAFDRKEIKAQDDEIERQLDEIGIAALADDIIRAENRPGDMLEVGRMLQRRAIRRVSGKAGDDASSGGD